MITSSISFLHLLLVAILLPTASTWCYKSYIVIPGEAAKVDINPDNAYIAVTSIAQNAVLIYDLANYNLVLNYTPSSGTVASAKFTHDGLYLGVGLSNGVINLISGRPSFSSNPILSFTSGGNVADIDFNSASSKLLVCYSNIARYDIYNNYTGTLIAVNTSSLNNIIRCKFSANDDIGFIDNNKNIKIFRAATNVVSTSITSNANLKQFDFKPTNATPIKFIATGNDTKSYYAIDNNPGSMTSNSFSLTSNSAGLSNGVMNPACYSGDAQYYAVGGGGSDGRVFLFYDNNTISSVFNDAISANNYPLASCEFTRDGSQLYVGTSANNNLAYIYIYKKYCTECAVGSYLATSTSCNLCNSGANMATCVSCTSATTCTGCIIGYYINQTSRLCYKCDYNNQGCSICVNNATCIQCNLNYFLNTSKLCQTCASAHTGCIICSNSTVCLTCSSEYYVSTGVCTRCNTIRANCLRCSSSTTCTRCQVGFFISAGSCNPCNANCISCQNSATNCNACVRGYYALSYACTACSTFCMECNESGLCLDCQAGTYLTGTGTCSSCTAPCDTCISAAATCLSCSIGYYLSGNNCLMCANNCTACVSSTNCSTCSLGYYLTAANLCLSCQSLFTACSTCNLTQCYSCAVSYYLSGANTCLSCVTGGCLLCSSSTVCQACAIGYYLTGTNTCSSCTASCESCSGSSNSCTSCIPGTYLSTTNCLSCSNNCQSCTSNTVCLSCNIGYYLNAGSCSSCNSQIYGCTDCISSTVCNSCQLGKYLTASNLCAECSSNCGSCTSSACLSCNTGYYLSTTSCLKCSNNCSECISSTTCLACNPGFYLNGAQCATCWGISRGCLTCNSTVCFNCQIGYYLNPSNLCTNCQTSISNCLYCLSSTSCQACAQGYYLVAGNTACNACNSVIDGCESCSSNTVCITCAIGFYLSGSTCTACASKCLTCNAGGCLTCAYRYSYSASDCLTCNSLIQHCEACNSSTTCLRCFEGFYLSTGTCLSCQSALVGCSYCNSSSICTTCMSGYYLSGNTCSLCSLTTGCMLCSSNTVCTTCATGYTLSGNTCVTCSTLLPSCIYCSSSTTCVQCTAGYYLNGASCSTCSSALSDCISCSSGTQCSMCEGGYYLNGLSCSACTVQGCEVCNALSPSQCVNCFSGYYLSGNTCLPCTISGCLDCNQSSTCLTCQLGYYLASSSTCSLCSAAISGCSKCSSTTTCTECQTLYYLSGSSCIPCSNTLIGCAFCTTPSSCLSCNSGYYLNSSSLCSLCTSLTGCLLCTSMSTCTYCNSGYYLSGGNCITCSSITQCAQCTSSTACTACISGYELGSSGSCVAIQTSSSSGGSGSPTTAVKNIQLKSYYVSSDTLKHILLVSGMNYNKVDTNIKSNVKLYVGTKTTSTLLTIKSYEWGKPNQLIFYTNNPLNLNVKSLNIMKRLLIGQSTSVNMNSSAQVSQSLLSTVLPNLLTDSDLTVGYNLDDPEFYNSYMSSVYNTYYYVFGMVVTCILFFNFMMKALCTVTHSSNHGYIMGHIFAIKTVSISLYPTFGEYINYAYGYMTADLPWLNSWLGKLLSDGSDYSPLGYRLYYQSMNIFSMYSLALVVFLFALSLNYLFFNDGGASQFKLQKNSQYLQRKQYSRFKALTQFLFNFFYFGLAFAGCASLQGSIFNPYNIISLNGLGYAIGIAIYMTLLGECLNTAYNDWNFERLRLFVKASLLSLAHFNPLYILVAVITLDICLLIIEIKLKWKYIVNIKLFITNQVLANFALGMIYYLPDSLFAIYLSAAGVFFVVPLEIFSHYLQKKVQFKNYPFFNKEEVLSSDKSSSEDASWKINLEDYTLEKEVAKNQLKQNDIQDENAKYPLIPVQDQSLEFITRSTNFKDQTVPPQADKNNRRTRRFRDTSKNRNTILNSSWTSFDMNNSS